MFEISPYIILIPFYIYLFVHFFLALINVKHLFRTGALTFTSFVFTAAFAAYTLIILGATWEIVGSFDWSTPISVDMEKIKYSPDAF